MKQITINQNSIFAKLYRFFYRDDLPMGLCLFFWKSLIALIFVIPYTLYIIPVLITLTIEKKKKSNKDAFLDYLIRDYDDSEWGSLIGYSFLGWVALLVTLAYLHGLVYIINTGIFFCNITAAFWVINTIVILVLVVAGWNDKIRPWWEMRSYNKTLAKAKEWFFKVHNKHPEDLADYTLLRMYQYREETVEDTTHWIDVLFESIRAFYDKNCPVITWK